MFWIHDSYIKNTITKMTVNQKHYEKTPCVSFFMKKRFTSALTNREKAFNVSIICQKLRTHEYFGNQACCANLNDCLFTIVCF